MAATIEVINIPAGTPAQWLVSGQLFFDIAAPNVGFSLSKARAEQNELDQIKDIGALPQAIPMTDKNRWILKDYIPFGVVDQSFPLIEVRATDGHMALKQNALAVLGIDDTAENFEIQLIRATDFWLKKAKDLYLTDLDLGTFTFTVANIEANWDNWKYDDGDDYYLFPPIHYGKGPDPETNFIYPAEYIRPLLSILGVLQEGFCNMGYDFRSPVLETDWGRRLWFYGLAKDFYDYPDKGDVSFAFRARKTDNLLPGVWDDSTPPYFDSGNNFATNGVYTNSSGGVIEMGFSVKLNNFTNPVANPIFVIMNLIIQDDTAAVQDTFVFKYPVAIGETVTVTHNYDVVELPPNWTGGLTCQYALQTGGAPIAVAIPISSEFASYFTGSKHLFLGDSFDLNQLVSEDFSFYDFLIGVTALGRFKWLTDDVQRTVWLYPREESDVFGETATGYLTGDSLDFTDKIVRRSRRAAFPTGTKKRFLRYQFKESTDDFIEQQDFPDRFPPFSKTVDLSTGINDTEVVSNPFFEPTGETLWNTVTMPAIWDNDSNDLSFNIAPRIMVAVGKIEQEKLDIIEEVTKWNWNGNVDQEEILYVGQDPRRRFTDGSDWLSPELSVVYGIKVFDLYTMFLRIQTVVERQGAREQFLMFLSIGDFTSITFRDALFLRYGGRDFFALPLQVDDFESGSGIEIPTPVTVAPDAQLSTAIVCTPPSALKTCKYTLIEESAWIINVVNVQLTTVDITLDEVIINGQNVLQATQSQTINSGNLTTESHGGETLVKNLVDILNNGGIPFMTFALASAPAGKCGGAMQVTYPEDYEWIIRANITASGAGEIGDPIEIRWDGRLFWNFSTAPSAEVVGNDGCGPGYPEGRWDGVEDCS